MNIHKNARLTPLGRERIVRQMLSGQTPEAVALAAGVCPSTVRKWVARFRAEGHPFPQLDHPGMHSDRELMDEGAAIGACHVG